MVWNQDLRAVEDCSCKVAAKHEDLLEGARIPRRYQECTLASFEVGRKRERKLRDEEIQTGLLPGYLAKVFPEMVAYPTAVAGGVFKQFKDRPGLLLQGPSNAGKTHLAVGLLRQVIDQGVGGVFVDYVELMSEIARSFTKRRDDTGGLPDDYFRNAPFIVLDNLGMHTPKDWVDDTTLRILEHRYSRNLPLVATTELELGRPPEGPFATDQHHLDARIGHMAYKRLMAMCTLVRL
jgi:DNA replication protein DnaC